MEKKALPAREAAVYVGLSVASFYRIARPQLRPIKYGRAVRYDRADLDDFVHAHKVAADE